jgi:hypothetical protein
MSSQSFESVFTELQESYEIIAQMTFETYDKEFLYKSLALVDKISLKEQQRIATVFYEILSTTAGTIYLNDCKSLTSDVVEKAQEFMKSIEYTLNEQDENALKLARTIVKFARVNEEVFLNHGISYTLYEGFYDDYDNDYDDYENDDEDDEYRTFHTFDSDTDFSEDEEEEEEEDVYERYIEIEKQKCKSKMVLVHEQLLRRDDPFYQTAISCIKNKKDWENEWFVGHEKKVEVLKKIIKRELELGNDILNDEYIQIDYKLIEMFTGNKVMDDFKKFGCNFCLRHDNIAAAVTIFDGINTHEWDIILDISLLVEQLKEDIRKERALLLYNTRLVCKNVASIISTYVC